jgi:hypothetical protein
MTQTQVFFNGRQQRGEDYSAQKIQEEDSGQEKNGADV